MENSTKMANTGTSSGAKSSFQPDSDVHITYEDQQKINKFARHNAKLDDLKEELKTKQQQTMQLKNESGKPRKTNFTAREVEVLLNNVRKYRDTVLFGVAGGQGWAQAWLTIAENVSTVEGILRTEGDVRKKWTYLKWEAKNTSKPGYDATSRAVLDILQSNWSDEANSRNLLPVQTPIPKKIVPPVPQPPPPPPEVCVRWNSYHPNMQTTFLNLLNNKQFVDVTLACEGQSIQCHKMILSACSTYFEELLGQNPCQHPIVLLKDMKFWEVRALVDFMYKGEVNVVQDKLPSLLSAAEALQIKGLAGPVAVPSSQEEDPSSATSSFSSEDYKGESSRSPSTIQKIRKRRTVGLPLSSLQQSSIIPSHNPVGRPRLIKPVPQPSTPTPPKPTQEQSPLLEPPARRPRFSESPSLPFRSIKAEPVEIDLSNNSVKPLDTGTIKTKRTYNGSKESGQDNLQKDDKAKNSISNLSKSNHIDYETSRGIPAVRNDNQDIQSFNEESIDLEDTAADMNITYT